MIDILNGIEFEVLGEKVRLRGLTIEEFYRLSNIKSKTEYLFVYHIAKDGIVSFEYVEDQEVKKYQKTEVEFEALFSQNFEFVRECAFIILNQLTVVSEEEKDWIKSFIAFNYYLSDKEQTIKDLWSCKTCIERGSISKRRCTRFTEDIQNKIIKEGYRPPEVFGQIEKKESESSKKNDGEDFISEANRKKLEKRNAKLSLKKTKPVENPETPTQPEEPQGAFVLKTLYYSWKTCPVYRGSEKFYRDFQLVLLSVSQDKYLFGGEVMKQPARFIEMLSEYKNETERIRHLEEKRIMKESEAKTQSARRKK